MINKKGSYIVEAAIILPAFIITLMMLISAVQSFRYYENTVFAACDELHETSIRAAYLKHDILTPFIIERRMLKENKNLSGADASSYRYLYKKSGISDLISLKVTASLEKINPIGSLSGLKLETDIMLRAFSGKKRSINPGRDDFDDEEDYEEVYVFPDRGERYHNATCSFLSPACQQTIFTDEIKNQFRPCEKCDSHYAKKGETVFCFFNTGKAFHYGFCDAVDKYYVEMEKEEAEDLGYSPCLICGG